MFPGVIGFPQQHMDATDFHALVARSTLLQRDSFGEKVLQTPEGLMVKIFRRKRLLTSATLFPYARRFVRNAQILSARGVPTVTVANHAYCPELDKHVVTYHPLPGNTVRNCLKNGDSNPEQLLPAVAAFVATLHQQGVYFRSLHFGNIIVAPEQPALGLIDVADMTIRSRPLGVRMRARNFRHLLRWREDAGCLQTFGGARFLEIYLTAAQLDPRPRQQFLELIRKFPEWSSLVTASSGS